MPKVSLKLKSVRLFCYYWPYFHWMLSWLSSKRWFVACMKLSEDPPRDVLDQSLHTAKFRCYMDLKTTVKALKLWKWQHFPTKLRLLTSSDKISLINAKSTPESNDPFPQVKTRRRWQRTNPPERRADPSKVMTSNVAEFHLRNTANEYNKLSQNDPIFLHEPY